MAHYRTKQELYDEVDRLFRNEHPEAPQQLSADGAEHAALRESWLIWRDVVLSREADRIYWEMYPEAPTQIDSNNAVHQQWIAAWNEIYNHVKSFEPQPAFGVWAMDQTDMRASILEGVRLYFGQIRPELHGDVRWTVESWLDTYREMVLDGRLMSGNYWEAPYVDLQSNEDPNHKVRLGLIVYHDLVHPRATPSVEVTNPLS
ncbi:MAG TPA: hypothetical protein VH761_00985 [Ilumatobacteraceae bacterium]|jgi:hypothetical protein